MDSITQIALGAVIGEAGYRQRLGGRAVLWGGFCGLAPDLDILVSGGDRWTSLVTHRGPSHSLIVLPVVSLLFGWLAKRYVDRGGGEAPPPTRYWAWTGLSFFGLMTHPLLDTFTAYGTQLLSPVSRARFAVDGVSIIDPLYTIPLLVALVLAARRSVLRENSRRFAQLMLGLTSLYLLWGWYGSTSVKNEAVASLRVQGVEVAHIRALPTFFNNRLFRVVAKDTSGGFHVAHHSLLNPAPFTWRSVPREGDPRVEAVLRSERGALFEWFSDGMTHARLRPSVDGEGAEVDLVDMRYGLYLDPLASVFRATAVMDASGEITRFDWQPRQRPGDMGAELEALYTLLLHGRLAEAPHRSVRSSMAAGAGTDG